MNDYLKNYTETRTFAAEVKRLEENGVSPENIARYTKMSSQYDENGCKIGTDYSNIVLAYPHPIP